MREVTAEREYFDDDRWAISVALALCAFLWGLKAVLVAYFLLAKGVNPLADAPVLGIIALGGASLFVCASLAIIYRVLLAVSRRMRRPFGSAIRGPGLFAIHAAVVVFAVLSFEVSRVYGWPLDIMHLRSADDPRIVIASIAAYAGLLPLSLIALGLLAQPTLGRVFSAALAHVGALRSPRRLWTAFGTFTIALFGVWFTQLRGINTYGVKDDPLAYFVMHYKPAFQPVDAKNTMQTLASELGAAREALAQPASLVHPAQMLRRDFNFDRDAASARGMNVLLIQMESTSAAHLNEKTTPTLMRLAEHAVTFRNHATVFSETSRSSYGIYFSDYLTDIGTTPRLLYQRPLPRTSLAAVLQDAGYDTAMVHSGFLSYADLRYMYEGTGFGTVTDATNLWSGEEELPWSWGVREEDSVAKIVELLKQPRTKPFFLVYATEFPHHPYTCPIADQPYPPTNWLNRYRNSLHYADKCIGILIEQMRELNLLDSTLIVVVGDHGETVSTYPVGHGLAISREEVFTPFMISNPRLFPRPQHSLIATNHLDIAPTLARLLDLMTPSEWLGRNMLAEEIPTRLLFMQAKLAKVNAVIDGGLVYVVECMRKNATLYDISNGGFERVPRGDARIALSQSYEKQNALFQKWAVWRHMARATGEPEITTVSTPRAEAAQPAAARVHTSSSAGP
jgi:hypothetical protein